MNKLLYCVALALILFTATCVEADDMSKIDRKMNEMLYTGVHIAVSNGGSGSGIIIYSGNGYSLILTAKHLLRKNTKLRVTVYPDEVTYPATLVKVSKAYDLALLSIDAEHDHVAEMTTYLELPVYYKVWKVGCGSGLEPHPDEGMVTAFEDEYMMSSAPITFGDSGGGIFVNEEGHYKLFGTIVMVGVGSGHPTPHHGYSHTILAIAEFLSKKTLTK